MTTKFTKVYNDLKKRHPEATLLFRVGDFYNSYNEDADTCSKTISVTILKDKEGHRYTSFPYHALDTYLPKLIRAGHRVAICDQ